MARISENSYDFGRSVFQRFGFGNPSLLMAFFASTLMLLLAITGFYFPFLAAVTSWILPLILGGGSFIGISLLVDFKPAWMLFGLIVGGIIGALSYALCASLIYISPVLTALLVLPNIIAAGSYAIGGVFSAFDACCAAIGRCCNVARNTESQPYSKHCIHTARQESSSTNPQQPNQSGMLFSRYVTPTSSKLLSATKHNN